MLMTFQYIPDESDYLTYLYYVTTKSKRIQKKRTINKMVILFIYFITGLFLYNKQGAITSAMFFLLCLPTYFLYSYFEKRQYLKHFTRYIRSNYKDEIGVLTTIELDEEGIQISISESTSKMMWSDMEVFSETGTIILIQQKDQNAIVIPKQKISNLAELIAELKRIATVHSIPYQEELNWKWK